MRRLAVALVLAPAATTQAVAQPAAAPVDVERLMQGLSSCVGAAEPEMVQGILDLPLLSSEQSVAIARNVPQHKCLVQAPTTLRFEATAMVGGLAEELFLRRFGERDIKWLVAQNGTARPRNQPEDLALCLVGRDPGNARLMLDTIPASPEETMMAKRLADDLQACVPQGMTLTFTPANVRMFSATGLYLSAHHPPVATTAAN
jgi:hypothetical protein